MKIPNNQYFMGKKIKENYGKNTNIVCFLNDYVIFIIFKNIFSKISNPPFRILHSFMDKNLQNKKISGRMQFFGHYQSYWLLNGGEKYKLQTSPWPRN